MADTTSDLPDPLESVAAGGGNPDELLSQLAGDEIDRLLSEADAEPPGAIETATVVTAEADPLQSQLDDLFNTINNEVAPAETSDAPAPITQSLDDRLAILAEELLPTAETSGMMTQIDAPAAVASSADEQERSELLAEESVSEDSEAEELLAEPRAPWALRPLLWLNTPFASLSDHARQFVGKVALATLLFSVTLLTYIAITRHKF